MKTISVLIAVFIVLFAVISSAGPKEMIEERFENMFKKDSEGWKDWETGLKEDHKFVLDSVMVFIQVLDEKKTEDSLVVSVKVTITCFCFNTSGNKKRFVRQMVMIYVFDKETNSPIQVYIAGQQSQIQDGWVDGLISEGRPKIGHSAVVMADPKGHSNNN